MMGENVTMVTKIQTGTNSRGNPVYSDVETVYPGCIIGYNADNEEHSADRSTVQQTATLHFTETYPTSENIADSEIIIRGQKWTVEGEGFNWDSPFTGDHFGFSLKVRRQNG